LSGCPSETDSEEKRPLRIVTVNLLLAAFGWLLGLLAVVSDQAMRDCCSARHWSQGAWELNQGQWINSPFASLQ